MVQFNRAPSLSPAVLHHVSFPGESAGYRAARNALLDEEMELRRLTERVAAQRRALPAGGAIPEDYQFDGDTVGIPQLEGRVAVLQYDPGVGDADGGEMIAPGAQTVPVGHGEGQVIKAADSPIRCLGCIGVFTSPGRSGV